MPRNADPADWMWAQACEMLTQAERMHRQFFRPAPAPQAQATWEPPVDVFESEHEIVVAVALPGVDARHVEVTSEPGALRVRAARPFPAASLHHAVRQLEIPYGAFERRIPLPAGRFELRASELADGCLILRLVRT